MNSARWSPKHCAPREPSRATSIAALRLVSSGEGEIACPAVVVDMNAERALQRAIGSSDVDLIGRSRRTAGVGGCRRHPAPAVDAEKRRGGNPHDDCLLRRRRRCAVGKRMHVEIAARRSLDEAVMRRRCRHMSDDRHCNDDRDDRGDDRADQPRDPGNARHVGERSSAEV